MLQFNGQLIARMETDHLIQAARAEFRPLMNTPLEAELLDRLEAAQDAAVDVGTLRIEIEEARMSIAEDFLYQAILAAHDLGKSGKRLASMLENIQTEVTQAVEYSDEKINSALDLLGED